MCQEALKSLPATLKTSVCTQWLIKNQYRFTRGCTGCNVKKGSALLLYQRKIKKLEEEFGCARCTLMHIKTDTLVLGATKMYEDTDYRKNKQKY